MVKLNNVPGRDTKRDRIKEGVAEALTAAAGNQSMHVAEDSGQTPLKKTERAASKQKQKDVVTNTLEWEMHLADFQSREMRVKGNIILDSNILHSDFRVFAILALYADWHNGICWPSLNELCRISGLAKSVIRRAIKKLEESGYITISKEAFKTTYILYPHNITEGDDVKDE